MVKGFSKTINLSAASMVDIKGDVGTAAALFSASFDKAGNVNFAESVQNREAYDEHFEEVLSDNMEFKRMVKAERDKMLGK